VVTVLLLLLLLLTVCILLVTVLLLPCRYVDALDLFGYTPLILATIYRNTEAITTLLSHEANLIARTSMTHPRYYM
jgi:ankyrin repeat protein